VLTAAFLANVQRQSPRDVFVLATIAAGAALAYVIDIQLSKGTLDGFPYLIPLIGSMFVRLAHVAFPLAGVLSFAAIMGHVHSDQRAALDREVLGGVNLVIAVSGLFGMAWAIEHQRQLRTRLDRKVAQLRESEESRNRVMSVIAHDLRSPLNPIIGFASILAESRTALKEAQVKDYAQTIGESARRLLATLDGLLDWARPDRGAARQNVAVVNLVNNAVALMEPVAAKKTVTLTVRAEAGTAHRDPVMISTVLRNLIANAIKFSFPGREVAVIARRMDAKVLFQVVDRGTGMKPAVARKLLAGKPIDSTAGTAGERGTGLGLGLCRSLVEKNGSALAIDSKPGHGTSVSFTLPTGA
jgi:signal transduction histidine kinase